MSAVGKSVDEREIRTLRLGLIARQSFPYIGCSATPHFACIYNKWIWKAWHLSHRMFCNPWECKTWFAWGKAMLCYLLLLAMHFPSSIKIPECTCVARATVLSLGLRDPYSTRHSRAVYDFSGLTVTKVNTMEVHIHSKWPPLSADRASLVRYVQRKGEVVAIGVLLSSRREPYT